MSPKKVFDGGAVPMPFRVVRITPRSTIATVILAIFDRFLVSRFRLSHAFARKRELVHTKVSAYHGVVRSLVAFFPLGQARACHYV